MNENKKIGSFILDDEFESFKSITFNWFKP